jgi:antitoxin component YwqK of YwqJK toxin-antitoxin module
MIRAGTGCRARWIPTSPYKTGPKHREGPYKDGKKDGLWTEWHQYGQKSEEATWKDGKKHGLQTNWYHRNGQKMKETTYKDGEKISSRLWDEDGNQTKYPPNQSMGRKV